jgi:3-deoxy-7-phosphoheptulonate synthase
VRLQNPVDAHAADGIIEAHDNPEHALTDGAQSITPKTLKDMMATLKKIAIAVDREI